MKKIKRNRLLGLIITVAVIFLLTPVVIFLKYFRSQMISSDINDWAAFGDYFGGLINPIISLFSLIILGYITYLLSEDSVLENKRLNNLKRKMDAFEELTCFMPKFYLIPIEMHSILKSLVIKIRQRADSKMIEDDRKRIFQLSLFFSEYYYFLKSFEVRFGHLFNYDFQCVDYKNLLNETNELRIHFNKIEDILLLLNDPNHDLDLKIDLTEKFEYLIVFINALRDELKGSLTEK